MTSISGVILKLYSILLKLYPASFRNEFKEQMLLDFTDMAIDARSKGRFHFLVFCLRELVDFPANLLRVHLKEGRILRILRSQPVNSGLRGAVGFSLGFAFAAIATGAVSRWLFSALEPTFSFLSVWVYDMFQNANGMIFLWRVPFLISSALNASVFGVVFALLLGNQVKFYRYLIAGALGWIIPVLLAVILEDSFGWRYFLNEGQMRVLGYLKSILPGIFLSAVFIIAESDRKDTFRYLVAGAIIYPLGTFLFIKLLFYLWLEITPWFFISLMALMIVLIGSVVAIALLNNHKMLSVVIAGATGYHLLNHAAFYISYNLLKFPSPPLGVGIPEEAFIVYQFYGTGYQAIFGALFGLAIGLILGYQKINKPPQRAAGI